MVIGYFDKKNPREAIKIYEIPVARVKLCSSGEIMAVGFAVSFISVPRPSARRLESLRLTICRPFANHLQTQSMTQLSAGLHEN